VWIEAERAGVDQQGGPDQIQAGRASRCLTNRIELGRRAREIGGGAAQAKVVIGDQGSANWERSNSTTPTPPPACWAA
jgi:hypothetical protein